MKTHRAVKECDYSSPTMLEIAIVAVGVLLIEFMIIFVGIPNELESREKSREANYINLTASCQRGHDYSCKILAGIESLDNRGKYGK